MPFLLRLLFRSTLALLPAISQAQDTSVRENIMVPLTNYRNAIIAGDSARILRLADLFKKWDKYGISADTKEAYALNLLYGIEIKGQSLERFKKKNRKRFSKSILMAELTIADYDILKENMDLFDLINEGILHFEYPYSIDSSSNYFKEMDYYAIKAGEAIAEIGAGEGTFGFLTAICFDNIRLYINDNSPGCVAYIEAKMERNYGLGRSNYFNVVKGTDESTKLEGMSLDKIIIRNAFHHFDRPDRMCQSIKAALKPGGQLFLFDPVPEFREVGRGCKHALPGDQMVEMVERNGFELVLRERIGTWLFLKFKVKTR
jgi:SAM-dependent methyltransferase